MAFLVIVACATTMTVPVVGALLIFTLMIGPPAAARCFTDGPDWRWLGSVVGRAGHHLVSDRRSLMTLNWPVGFFVGMLSALGTGRAAPMRAGTAARSPPSKWIRPSPLNS